MNDSSQVVLFMLIVEAVIEIVCFYAESDGSSTNWR